MLRSRSERCRRDRRGSPRKTAARPAAAGWARAGRFAGRRRRVQTTRPRPTRPAGCRPAGTRAQPARVLAQTRRGTLRRAPGPGCAAAPKSAPAPAGGPSSLAAWHFPGPAARRCPRSACVQSTARASRRAPAAPAPARPLRPSRQGSWALPPRRNRARSGTGENHARGLVGARSAYVPIQASAAWSSQSRARRAPPPGRC